jgi:thioredoxin-like negative regulator of GroEL
MAVVGGIVVGGVRAETPKRTHSAQQEAASHPKKPTASELLALRKRVRAHPQSRIARLNLAQAYDATGDETMALYHFQWLLDTATPEDRNDGGEWDSLLRAAGRLNLALHHPKKAAPLLKRALAIHPWDTDLRNSLCRAYLAAGQRNEAARVLKEGRKYYAAQGKKPVSLDEG